jgi:hypothetical protein
MTRDEQQKLFREWEADYAARRDELEKPRLHPPTPSQIIRESVGQQSQTEPEREQKRDGRSL